MKRRGQLKDTKEWVLEDTGAYKSPQETRVLSSAQRENIGERTHRRRNEISTPAFSTLTPAGAITSVSEMPGPTDVVPGPSREQEPGSTQSWDMNAPWDRCGTDVSHRAARAGCCGRQGAPRALLGASRRSQGSSNLSRHSDHRASTKQAGRTQCDAVAHGDQPLSHPILSAWVFRERKGEGGQVSKEEE